MTEQNTNPDLRQDSANGKRHGRRRFLGAGAAATPFLLTLVSQPALGNTCFTPSRSLSRNTSVSQQGQYGVCQKAASPAMYAASSQAGEIWPGTVPPSTPVEQVFSQLPMFTKQVEEGGTWVAKSMTMGEALQVSSADPVYSYLIAAYLNTMGGNGAVIPVSVLNVSNIREMWQQCATGTGYEPMAGIKWYADDIVNYLKTNDIVGY